MALPFLASDLDAAAPMLDEPAYSVCTLVTKERDYAEMRSSFQAGGFDAGAVEYLYIDNCSGNRFDAYQAVNTFLLRAKGRHIILCHQDIVLMEDGRDRLDRIIAELDRLDPAWALFGNAGSTLADTEALRISHPHQDDASVGGPFPVRVNSLDENFIVVKRSANLAVSHDLSGFHFYGLDLCVIADILGRNAYVVDFHLRHKSGGTLDAVYFDARTSVTNKYKRAFRDRNPYTSTLKRVPLSGSPFYIFRSKALRRLRGALLDRE